MTALAISKTEIAAKISFAVVTRRAGLRAGAAEMLGRRGRADLPRLRRACGEFVAVIAREALACAVFRMTERETKGARVCGSRAIGFLIVTDAARGDLAARIRFTRGCVTRVAVVVRREVCGN